MNYQKSEYLKKEKKRPKDEKTCFLRIKKGKRGFAEIVRPSGVYKLKPRYTHSLSLSPNWYLERKQTSYNPTYRHVGLPRKPEENKNNQNPPKQRALSLGGAKMQSSHTCPFYPYQDEAADVIIIICEC